MRNKRLLIVDDSEIDRAVLKSILCNDFDISEAENGYLALEAVMKDDPHIDGILLDISMPVIDGFDVLYLMKRHNLTKIPVIPITAEATEENVYKTAPYNVPAFICKPFDPSTILGKMRALFRYR